MIALMLALLLQRSDADTMALIELPPVRFRGDINAIVHFVDPSKLPALCGTKIEVGKTLLGCVRSSPMNVPKQMFVSNPCLSADQLYARELCHELGHLHSEWDNHGP